MFKNFLSKLKDTSVRFLKFMRLVGDDGHWDWTTASLVAVLFVLVFKVSSPGIAEIATFSIALLARGHKKQLASKVAVDASKQLEAAKAELANAQTKANQAMQSVDELKTRLGLEAISNPFGGFTGMR